jgi:hypothetical protein
VTSNVERLLFHWSTDCNWPGAGTRIAGNGATLPNFQGIPERPVWSGQFQKANVAWQSFRDIRWRRKLTDGRNVWYRENRAAVVQRKESVTNAWFGETNFQHV